MSEKRILFILPTYSIRGAGVTEAPKGLAKQLAANTNLSISAIALDDPDTDAALRDWDEINIHRVKNSGLGFSLGLKKKIKDINPDIIHIHGLWVGIGIQAAFWAMRNNVKYFVSPHGMMDKWAWNKSRFRKFFFYHLFQKKVLLKSSGLHSLNEEEKASVKEILPNKDSFILPNGICIDDYSRNSNEINDKKKLLFLGRMDPKKSVLELVMVWVELIQEDKTSGWTLEIAGSGDANYEKALKQAAGEYLNKGISFKGHVQGMKKFNCFKEASAFILPSKSEGLPVAILEAWAASLPAAISKECNLPDSLDLGLAFEVYSDKKKLKKRLTQFIGIDANKLETMGNDSLEYVRRHYSWTSIAKEFTRLYDEYKH